MRTRVRLKRHAKKHRGRIQQTASHAMGKQTYQLIRSIREAFERLLRQSQSRPRTAVELRLLEKILEDLLVAFFRLRSRLRLRLPLRLRLRLRLPLRLRLRLPLRLGRRRVA